ncbi:MAG: hypothetical protein KDD33_05020 [Bdellovibrionales bacterium]|nr:hypothetical protein [Bdellovibrionales bacterium]
MAAFRTFIGRCFLCIGILFILAACSNQGLDIKSNGGFSISGKVELSSLSLASAHSLSCSSPTASLYSLDSAGNASEKLISSEVLDDGSYEINTKSLGIHLNSAQSTQYSVVIDGCSESLSRPVTGYKDQNVSIASSLIEKIGQIEYPDKVSLASQPPSTLDTLINLLSEVQGPDFPTVYDGITSRPEIIDSFQTIFNVPLTELVNSPPRINAIQSVDSVNELGGASFSLSASHWYPSYSMIIIWKLDGSVVSNSANYTFTPGKNEQGLHTLELFIGKNDGASGLDISKAYQNRTFTIDVLDVFPAQAPSFIVVEGAASSSRNIHLNLTTGPGMSLCDSFSSLALTEDDPSPPTNLGDYSLNCTSGPNQVELYTLSPGEGSKTLRLWARDSSGNISSTPVAQSVIFDETNPAVNLSAPTAQLRGGASETLSFTASDAVSGLSALDLYFAADGVNYSLVADVLGQSNYNWSIPAIDSVVARLKLVATDLAGNSAESITSAFVIDSTAPVAPSVSLVTNATTNSTATQVQVASCLDRQDLWLAESATTPLPDDLGWVTCQTSPLSFTLSSGDGTKTIYVFAKDAAGNVSASDSVSVNLDQTPPSISIATDFSGMTLSGNPTQAPAINQFNLSYSASDGLSLNNSSVEAQYCLTICGSEINWQTSQSGITYAGGIDNYIWTIPNINSTSVQFRLRVTDTAGNTSASSASAVFVIDSQAPSISAISLNNGNGSAAGVSLPFSATVSDNMAATLEYKIGLSSNLSSVAWSSSLPSLYNLPFTSGTYVVYLMAKDEAGNLTTVTPTNSVDLVLGSPPEVTIHGPAGGATFSVLGEDVDILWEIATPSGFPVNADGISIFYTLDFGVSQTPWPSGASLSPLTNGGCTLSGSATGCARIALPVELVGTKFQIIVKAEDSASAEGLAMSPSYNIPTGLSLVAGNDATAMGGSALSTTLKYYSNSGIFRDPTTGDIYLTRNCDILRIEGSTGKVNRWAGNPLDCSFVADGTALSAVRFSGARKIRMDSNGNILWVALGRLLKYDKLTGLVSTVIGPAVTPHSNVSGTDARHFNGGVSDFFLGKNDQIYFAQETSFNCSGTNYNGQRIVWKLEGDNTVSNLYGLPSSCTLPSNGAMANSVMIFAVALVPGDDSSEDRFYVQGINTYTFNLYRINDDGTVLEVLNQSGSGNFVRLYDYNIERGIPMVGQYRVNFWNPKTDVFESNTHTFYDPPTNGGAPDIFSDPTGGYYYLTPKGNFISYVNTSDVRATVAGIDPAFGDGGDAKLAQLRSPSELAFDSSGNLYINDASNLGVRRVNASGIIDRPWGGNSAIFSTGESSEVVANYQYGIATSDGKGGRQTVSLADGNCRYLCGTLSDTYLATEVSGTSALVLTRGPSGPPNGLLRDKWSFDGTNSWVHVEEFVSGYGNTRHYIYKFDILGNFTRIAGDPSLPDDASAVSDGLAVSGNTAGSGVAKFMVVNDVMYQGGPSGRIYTALEGGNWKQQTANCGISRAFVVLPDNSMVYACGKTIYRKAYQADGLGTSTAIVDLTGLIPENVNCMTNHLSENGVIYFTVGNSVYKYYNLGLEI